MWRGRKTKVAISHIFHQQAHGNTGIVTGSVVLCLVHVIVEVEVAVGNG